MDKQEILLELMKIFWDTYQELYPEENGFTFSAYRVGIKDTYTLYKWGEEDKVGKAETWHRFRGDK